eukprot:TRINITY_DN16205_c0_g1_i1.p1 TRINITY_DN16205_c0_g1~~TRINITY_DN16205_c0_g1_i1.p1  ORF type:complete len:1180 (+),score=250.06 TRINITY_DN16205_c0_g1_i1:65-3604(+)
MASFLDQEAHQGRKWRDWLLETLPKGQEDGQLAEGRWRDAVRHALHAEKSKRHQECPFSQLVQMIEDAGHGHMKPFLEKTIEGIRAEHEAEAGETASTTQGPGVNAREVSMIMSAAKSIGKARQLGGGLRKLDSDLSGVSAAESRQITRDHFENWTQQVQVREMQKMYHELLEDAKENSLSFEEQLKVEGFRDNEAFYRSCPHFELDCSPEDLAELGSGFVLYFHFLRFMAAMLFLLVLFQIPGVVYYGHQNNAGHWAWYSETSSTSSSEARCSCIGEARASRIMRENADYGKTCGAWDLDRCLNEAATVGKPGKWCCQSWCFVSAENCHENANSTFPSLSTVSYRGLLRSSEGCTQNTSLDQYCQDMEDVAFHPSTLGGREGSNYVQKEWLTPGSTGPNAMNNEGILAGYVLFIPVFCAAMVGMSQHQLRTLSRVESVSTLPADFAVLVRGMPEEETNEEAIRKFFSEHAMAGEDNPAEVVKVVIGFDSMEFRDRLKELHALSSKMKKLPPGDPEVLDAEEKVRKIHREFVTSRMRSEASLKSSGTVVVTFRYQDMLMDCLDRWEGFWARTLGRDPSGSGYHACCPGSKLPAYEFQAVSYPLKITQAPNPGDINWEDLGHSSCEKYKSELASSVIMCTVLLIGLCVTFGCNRLQAWSRWRATQANPASRNAYAFQALSFLPAGCVAIVNAILKAISTVTASHEVHETKTEEEFSCAVKSFVCLILNTSGIMLVLNWSPAMWYVKGGLIDDVFYMLLMDATLARASLLIDFGFIMGYTTRRLLSDEKLDEWNAGIEKSVPPTCKEDYKLLTAIKHEVQEFKAAFEPSEFDVADRYARVLNTFFCAVFFSPLWPSAALLGIFALGVQYACDKVMLLRWWKRPSKVQNEKQAKDTLLLMRYTLPFGLCYSMYVFIGASWLQTGEITLQRWFGFGLFLSALFACLPWTLWRTVLGFRLFLWDEGKVGMKRKCLASRAEAATNDYYRAQHMWPKTMKYHMDQFLYKRLPKRQNPEMLNPESGSLTAECCKKGLQEAPPVEEVLQMPIKEQDELLGTASMGTESMGTDSIELGTGTVSMGFLDAMNYKPLPKSEAVNGALVEMRASWQFEADCDWQDYDTDCQTIIEVKYQHFQKGRGNRRLEVYSQAGAKGITVSIDFQLMTQKVVKGSRSTRIRKIRRVESE